MNRFIAFISVFSLLFLFVKNADAKVLPQAQRQVGTAKSYIAGFSIFPRLRNDRKALIVSFSNLQSVTSASYSLIYTTNGQQEGAVGGISPQDANTTRELLFGTCSKNDCRYHTNITNARLEVSYISTNGKKYLRRYKIKI